MHYSLPLALCHLTLTPITKLNFTRGLNSLTRSIDWIKFKLMVYLFAIVEILKCYLNICVHITRLAVFFFVGFFSFFFKKKKLIKIVFDVLIFSCWFFLFYLRWESVSIVFNAIYNYYEKLIVIGALVRLIGRWLVSFSSAFCFNLVWLRFAPYRLRDWAIR